MNTAENKRLKQVFETLDWTSLQQDILFGTLLGDASLQTQNQGKTYRYKFLQSQKHKAYFDHVIDQLKPWMHKKSRFNFERQIWENETLAHSKWNIWNQIFYKRQKTRKKRIPEDHHLKKYLTPRAFAYWFMDDGGLLASNSKGLVLYTQAFLKEDVEKLAQYLHKQYALKTWVKFNKQKPVLAISGESFEKSKKFFKPYIHASMLYKFPEDRKRS